MTPKQRGAGWPLFAGTFFFITGIFGVISGLSALFRKEYFDEGGLIYENLRAWGWTWLILGAVVLIVGWLIISGSPAGRTAGIVIAGLGMVIWFASIGAYPWWAIVNLVVYGLIIYGLTAYSDEY